MPFFNDIGPRDEDRGPIWGAFATLADQVERLVAVNIAWAIQMLPGIGALAFPDWPLWLRLLLGLYSATALALATGALYGLAAYACRREHVSVELALELLRELAMPSLRTLAPLYGTFGVLIWLAVLVPPLRTAATLVLLLWSLCATYWGPMLADQPDRSPVALARGSVRLVWRYPLETLLTCGVLLLALVIGVVSIGGLFLIVPVLVTLLQTHRHLELARRGSASSVGST